MENVNLVRIDFRLIHGQVITKWMKHVVADTIIVVDDALAADEFMASIYTMAAPSDVEVLVYSVEKATNEWHENQFNNKNILMLFKDVASLYKAYELKMPFDKVQIGGLGSGPKKKKVFGPINMEESEFELLNQMHKDNVEIYLHQVPDEKSMGFDKVIQKFNK